MLARLRIENLALVEHLELELAPGLNVLSGETGAGKSVLVEALALLVGDRAETEAVRTGEAGAVVEGVFRLETPELRQDVASVIGEQVEELALRRELLRDQRNRCYVAGRVATAGLLRELGERLIELHGQHEHQLLLRASVQRELLDAFGGLEADRLALEWGVGAWRERMRRLETIREGERARVERIRALSDEVADIAGAAIDLDRESELAAEAERLRHVEDRLALAAGIAQALAGAEPSAWTCCAPSVPSCRRWPGTSPVSRRRRPAPRLHRGRARGSGAGAPALPGVARPRPRATGRAPDARESLLVPTHAPLRDRPALDWWSARTLPGPS